MLMQEPTPEKVEEWRAIYVEYKMKLYSLLFMHFHVRNFQHFEHTCTADGFLLDNKKSPKLRAFGTTFE